MTLGYIQDSIARYMTKTGGDYWSVFRMLAKLQEEGGEVARALNQLYDAEGKKKSKNMSNLEEELVDVIFVVGCIANYHTIDLQEAWKKKMKKRLKKK